jgi:hypothetical protein
VIAMSREIGVVARSDRVSAMVVQYSNLQYMTREPWVARGQHNVQSRPRKSRCVKFKVMMEGRKELANGLSEAASCQERKEKGEKGEKGEKLACRHLVLAGS